MGTGIIPESLGTSSTASDQAQGIALSSQYSRFTRVSKILRFAVTSDQPDFLPCSLHDGTIPFLRWLVVLFVLFLRKPWLHLPVLLLDVLPTIRPPDCAASNTSKQRREPDETTAHASDVHNNRIISRRLKDSLAVIRDRLTDRRQVLPEGSPDWCDRWVGEEEEEEEQEEEEEEEEDAE